jgi:hypothetical protein
MANNYPDSSVSFTEISVQAIADEILKEMASAHAKEVGIYSDEDFEPNVEHYFTLDRAGVLKTFSMRNEAQELVGYAVYVVTPSQLYPGKIAAQQDLLYVTPAYRGRFAYDFVGWMDEKLRGEQVDYVVRSVTIRADYSKMLQSMKYVNYASTHIKTLRG